MNLATQQPQQMSQTIAERVAELITRSHPQLGDVRCIGYTVGHGFKVSTTIDTPDDSMLLVWAMTNEHAVPPEGADLVPLLSRQLAHRTVVELARCGALPLEAN